MEGRARNSDEDPGACRLEDRFWYPGVLPANLFLVLVEPGGRRAQNAQVYVDHQRGIPGRWRYRMPGCQYQVVHPFALWNRATGRSDNLHSPLGALLLVVSGVGVVHRIVKPECHQYLTRSRGQGLGLAPPHEAFFQVLQCVVGSRRVAVARQQGVKHPSLRGSNAEERPGLPPVVVHRHRLAHPGAGEKPQQRPLICNSKRQPQTPLAPSNFER